MPPLIAIRCLTTGFVATKISRLRAGSSEWSFVPRPNVYARRSLRSLGCYCGCRLARRPTDWTDKGDGQGWVESAVSVLFDSPSSPCSPGTYGITTSGYLPHTLMVFVQFRFNHNTLYYNTLIHPAVNCPTSARIVLKMAKTKNLNIILITQCVYFNNKHKKQNIL